MLAERTVIVTARSFGSGQADPEDLLRRAGLGVVRGDAAHDLAALEGPLVTAEGWIAGTSPITAAHLDLAPRLRVIARYGVGLDSVDLVEAARRGITVTNTPSANADAVADLSIGLILVLLRSVIAADAAFRRGDGKPVVGRELGASTVGIVGYGAIGRRVRRRLEGFGAVVVAHDPFLTQADVPLLDLVTLASRSDVITLHAPAGEAPLIDATVLGLVKRGAMLVNVAREALVDVAAVEEALRDGRLGGYATDVMESRSGSLLQMPNVVATAHIASHTVDAIDRMGLESAASCVRILGTAASEQGAGQGP